MLRYVVCGEQTAARCSAARVQPLAAGPYVPFSPSVPLSLTLALILSLSDSPGSALCHCHSLVVSQQAGWGLSSTERRVTPGEQRQLKLQVNGKNNVLKPVLTQNCFNLTSKSVEMIVGCPKSKCSSPEKGALANI